MGDKRSNGKIDVKVVSDENVEESSEMIVEKNVKIVVNEKEAEELVLPAKRSNGQIDVKVVSDENVEEFSEMIAEKNVKNFKEDSVKSSGDAKLERQTSGDKKRKASQDQTDCNQKKTKESG